MFIKYQLCKVLKNFYNLQGKQRKSFKLEDQRINLDFKRVAVTWKVLKAFFKGYFSSYNFPSGKSQMSSAARIGLGTSAAAITGYGFKRCLGKLLLGKIPLGSRRLRKTSLWNTKRYYIYSGKQKTVEFLLSALYFIKKNLVACSWTFFLIWRTRFL